MKALALIDLSIQGLVELVVYLLVLGGIVWLLLWLVDYIAPPAPFLKVLKCVIVGVGVLALIGVLMNFLGYPVFVMRH